MEHLGGNKGNAFISSACLLELGRSLVPTQQPCSTKVRGTCTVRHDLVCLLASFASLCVGITGTLQTGPIKGAVLGINQSINGSRRPLFWLGFYLGFAVPRDWYSRCRLAWPGLGMAGMAAWHGTRESTLDPAVGQAEARQGKFFFWRWRCVFLICFLEVVHELMQLCPWKCYDS